MNRRSRITQSVSIVMAFPLLAGLGTPVFAQSQEEILHYAGADREKVLAEGAAKEGELVVYSAMIADQALQPLTDAFMKKYPSVTVTFWRGDSEDIAQRVLAEERANNVVVDVVEGTSVSENLIKAEAVQTFTSPMLDQYPDSYRDPNHLWAATRVSYYCMAYNTDMVNAADVPKSYEDLLDPKWQGQIAWRIGSESGTPLFITNLRSAWGEEKAEEYLKKLSAQKIVNFGAGSARTLVDRVIAGEYAMALNVFCHHPLISAEDGAPVASQLMSPVASTTATLLIPKNIRHPYGAALFTDFLLSEDGQKILLGADYFPAHPKVLPSEMLQKIVPHEVGYEENLVRPEALVNNGKKSDELYQTYFR
ncbi:ABC transporter substrate-binding protein [Sinorhizobium mexicanum]|uniref:Extracellular solute-binding protein n=1 Tax=Sinorhizobium mexicanum TaxID=375549 RepID=A0A859QCA5_9HYPH|nr:extracellular solute-binding protein [Sinorhizobium mexicanum]MBP1881979.1 ABC-type Fe3+ transport system substrate-binding protein [Sinorhizobium mexicanum]QLL61713.1 extracellular solute-binding protein [Sinorhizobium mexicanum]